VVKKFPTPGQSSHRHCQDVLQDDRGMEHSSTGSTLRTQDPGEFRALWPMGSVDNEGARVSSLDIVCNRNSIFLLDFFLKLQSVYLLEFTNNGIAQSLFNLK